MVRLAVLLASLLGSTAASAAEGMPQLDFGNRLTLLQVFWLVVIFTGLYFLLSRWALPRVGAVLEQRAASIASDLEVARRAKSEADEAVGELTRATREAQNAAGARIAEAVARAKEAAARQEATQNAALETQLAAAEQRISSARASALSAMRQVATDTAGTVVARLTGRAVDGGAVDAEVGRVLAARGQA